MKHYQVSVTIVDEAGPEPQKLSIQVKGLPQSLENDSEENGNVISELFRHQDYVEVAAFEVLKPRDCFLTVEAIRSPKLNAVVATDSGPIEEKVNVCHTSASETSPNLFQVHEDGTKQRYSLSINLGELKNADGAIFYINTEHDCNNNDETELTPAKSEQNEIAVEESTVQDQDAVDASKGNEFAAEAAVISELSAAGIESTSEGETIDTSENAGAELGKEDCRDENALPPVKLQIMIQDNLQITLAMKNYKPMKISPIDSTESAVASDVDSEYLEFTKSAKNDVSANANGGRNIPRASADLRQEIFKRLIAERLHGLGFSNREASDITETWSNGYVKHRALTLRKSKKPDAVRPSSPENNGNEKVPWLHPTTFSGTEIETNPAKLPSKPYTKPIHCLFHLMDTVIGILNSETCAILEAHYLLVLPHLGIDVPKSSGAKFHDLGYDCNFMKNWVDMIYLAAHQISVTHPTSVLSLANNELKALKKAFTNAHKICKTINKKLKTLVTDVGDFRTRLLSTIRDHTNWPRQLLERKVKPNYNTDHVQTQNFSMSSIFENHLTIRVAKDYGLFLRKSTNKSGWHAFSNLKALEKRLIFIAMVDHAKTTMDTIATTLRHQKELYTAGYPTSITKRMECLRSILWHEFEALKVLPLRTKLEIHGKMDHLIKSLERFEHVYNELAIKLQEGKRKLKQMTFHASTKKTVEFIKMKSVEITNSHIIIPFVSLPVHELDMQGGSDVQGPKMLMTRTELSKDTNSASNSSASKLEKNQ